MRCYPNLAVVYLLQRCVAEAIAAANEAIRLAPLFPNGYFNLGNAFLLQENWERAISAFQKAVELKPNWTTARKAYAGALASAERTDEAVAEYHQVLRLAPKDVESWIQLGANLHLRALIEKSRYGAEAAKEALEQARRLDPHYPELKKLLRDVTDTLKIRIKLRLPWQKK